MDEWMDGWIGGWIEGIDGWTDGWIICYDLYKAMINHAPPCLGLSIKSTASSHLDCNNALFNIIKKVNMINRDSINH